MLLFLSDVSGSEVLLIFVFVLIFFGAKSIPNLAKTLGKTIHQIKNASNDIQNEIKKSGLDMKNDMNLSNLFQETARDIADPILSEANQMEELVNAPVGVRAYGSELPKPEVVETIHISSETPLETPVQADVKPIEATTEKNETASN
jgi:TatA/E family protein of Tat protein translocase